MKRNKKNPPQNNQPKGILLCALMGSGVGFLTILLLALLMPMAIINSADPNSLAMPISAACVGLGTMAGSATAAFISKDAKFLSGMSAALIPLVPMALISLLLSGEFNMMNGVIIFIALGVSGAASSFAVSKIGSSRKKAIKRAMKRR